MGHHQVVDAGDQIIEGILTFFIGNILGQLLCAVHQGHHGAGHLITVFAAFHDCAGDAEHRLPLGGEGGVPGDGVAVSGLVENAVAPTPAGEAVAVVCEGAGGQGDDAAGGPLLRSRGRSAGAAGGEGDGVQGHWPGGDGQSADLRLQPPGGLVIAILVKLHPDLIAARCRGRPRHRLAVLPVGDGIAARRLLHAGGHDGGRGLPLQDGAAGDGKVHRLPPDGQGGGGGTVGQNVVGILGRGGDRVGPRGPRIHGLPALGIGIADTAGIPADQAGQVRRYAAALKGAVGLGQAAPGDGEGLGGDGESVGPILDGAVRPRPCVVILVYQRHGDGIAARVGLHIPGHSVEAVFRDGVGLVLTVVGEIGGIRRRDVHLGPGDGDGDGGALRAALPAVAVPGGDPDGIAAAVGHGGKGQGAGRLPLQGLAGLVPLIGIGDIRRLVAGDGGECDDRRAVVGDAALGRAGDSRRGGVQSPAGGKGDISGDGRAEIKGGCRIALIPPGEGVPRPGGGGFSDRGVVAQAGGIRYRAAAVLLKGDGEGFFAGGDGVDLLHPVGGVLRGLHPDGDLRPSRLIGQLCRAAGPVFTAVNAVLHPAGNGNGTVPLAQDGFAGDRDRAARESRPLRRGEVHRLGGGNAVLRRDPDVVGLAGRQWDGTGEDGALGEILRGAHLVAALYGDGLAPIVHRHVTGDVAIRGCLGGGGGIHTGRFGGHTGIAPRPAGVDHVLCTGLQAAEGQATAGSGFGILPVGFLRRFTRREYDILQRAAGAGEGDAVLRHGDAPAAGHTGFTSGWRLLGALGGDLHRLHGGGGLVIRRRDPDVEVVGLAPVQIFEGMFVSVAGDRARPVRGRVRVGVKDVLVVLCRADGDGRVRHIVPVGLCDSGRCGSGREGDGRPAGGVMGVCFRPADVDGLAPEIRNIPVLDGRCVSAVCRGNLEAAAGGNGFLIVMDGVVIRIRLILPGPGNCGGGCRGGGAAVVPSTGDRHMDGVAHVGRLQGVGFAFGAGDGDATPVPLVSDILCTGILRRQFLAVHGVAVDGDGAGDGSRGNLEGHPGSRIANSDAGGGGPHVGVADVGDLKAFAARPVFVIGNLSWFDSTAGVDQ